MCPGCMTSYGPVAHARSVTSVWHSWCGRRWRRNQKAVRIGVSGKSQQRHECRNRRCTASGRPSDLEPHRQKHFKLLTDPFFVEKVGDIVGLYLNPPENAVVLCVDEKSQIQALERTQPMLPMGLGYYVEGVTHDYRRHGTTTLFAALDTVKGQVFTQCRQRHRHQEYLGFLREIEKNVPETLDVHLIADNYATHKHPRVRRWFAQRPRFHMHFTPTYASWLNQVEMWFNRITQQAIRVSYDSLRGTRGQIRNWSRKSINR